MQPLITRLRTDVTAVKREGRQAWTREPLTNERLLRHLNGGPARGLSQIKAGESVTMVGLLDFDSHGGETPWPAMVDAARHVADSIKLLGGAPILFRSSGGRGIHLYCLWDVPQDAYSVRQWLTAALMSCGYENGAKGVQARQIEVFPKQNEVLLDGFGNQSILPLAGESVPMHFEPLIDDWILGSREDIASVSWSWPMSEPIPLFERPKPMRRDALEVVGFDDLKTLLAAVPNAGAEELGYDEWRDVVFIVHHETEGSGAGLTLAHDFSSRSRKYDASFLDERVWPFIRSDRENVKGIGSLKRLASRYGWHEPLNADAFEDISEQDNRPPMPATIWIGIDPGDPAGDVGVEQTFDGGVLVGTVVTRRDASMTPGGRLVQIPDTPRSSPPPIMLSKVKRRGIPEAHYLTTDQANAQRLKASFGSMVFVAAGKWHVWDGKRWVADESDVYRYACRLSDIVRTEAKGFEAKAADAMARGDTTEATKLGKIAEALRKWALKCEMKGTIEAAIGLARKMLTVDSEVLDRDPWALNVLNGIVDLRTGLLRRHDPGEYITKLVPVAYQADARCDLWESVLAKITLEHDRVLGARPVAQFLQRWFGYCLTGKTTEQCFVVHWGAEGSNGKSTVLDLMADTLGDYAGTAAPGLLTASKNEHHPTEIADLFGRRMVTAHESSEGIVLREDFIKQATGGDKLKARYMREDFFEFPPTHKLQLLTNHKPVVKGTDGGIWRRVRLVPYVASFGDEGEVARGERRFLIDREMPLRLRSELEGILAWRVRGAVEWVQVGLQAPDVVRNASEAYKSEQDRVGQFVAECCELGLEFEEVLAGIGGMSATDGLYPEYVRWCKEGGVYPLSKSRFTDDVLRVVPGGRIAPKNIPLGNGKRRSAKVLRGVRLAIEVDD